MNHSQKQAREAFSPREFAEAHGLSRSRVYQLWSEGLGPKFFRVGRRVLIPREAAQAWRLEMLHGAR